MTEQQLVNIALEAKENAYCPYSNFKVGAALLTYGERVYTGCNIENSSFGATNCAERTAVYKAVSEGEKHFKMIAIASDSDKFTYPCGICRQVFSEFMGKSFKIICSDKAGNFEVHTLEHLLQHAFLKDSF